MRRFLLFLSAYLCTGMVVFSCSKPPLELAFQGKLPIEESNKVISDYCMGCHVHVSFRSDEHLVASHQFYDRLPYQNAQECRVCHYIREEGIFLPSVHRGTRWPQWVVEGRFKRFETRELARTEARESP